MWIKLYWFYAPRMHDVRVGVNNYGKITKILKQKCCLECNVFDFYGWPLPILKTNAGYSAVTSYGNFVVKVKIKNFTIEM